MPQVDRLTEEAHATGAVNTLTKEGRKLVGHNTDVPGFKVALDQLVGRQKMPRHAVVLGAGGGARAVVYGLIREGFQRVIVFNRHLHRAESLVKHFGRSAVAHGPAGDALARVDHRGRSWPRRRCSSTRPRSASPRDDTPVPAEILTPELFVLDLIYAKTRLLRDAAVRRRGDRRTARRCCSTRARRRSRCGPGSRPRSTSWPRPSSRRGPVA